MEIRQALNADAILELKQMLDRPIEDLATAYELEWLDKILDNGLRAVQDADNEKETRAALSFIIKSAFVIGRRSNPGA